MLTEYKAGNKSCKTKSNLEAMVRTINCLDGGASYCQISLTLSYTLRATVTLQRMVFRKTRK